LSKTKSNSGQTGPKTAAGKAVSSVNAVKTGLLVSGWIDKSEELEYEELFRNLCADYNAQTTPLLLQIEAYGNYYGQNASTSKN
jgi:tartrate dehydratase beta subunit/fumarate hydratase class I family protein